MLSHWNHKWLSLGGRYILVQYVLQNIVIFCMHKFMVPCKIIKHIESIMENFPWTGSRDCHKFHLAHLDDISYDRVLEDGVSRTSNIFNWATLTKRFWRVLSSNGRWQHIVKRKYLKDMSISKWFRSGTISCLGGSHIWNGFIHISKWILNKLKWSFANGNKILISIDPIVGLKN